MARVRVARDAQRDIARILETSAEQWGPQARQRYAAMLAHAMRQVAVDPMGTPTRERSELSAGLRMLHLRHARQTDPAAGVGRPVHILFYRVVQPGLVEIVRVLHERMEASRHLRQGAEDER